MPIELLRIEKLEKHFKVEKGFLVNIGSNKRKIVRAIDGVTLSLWKGETLGVAGETGSGKTTLAKTVVGLIPPTAGKIYFDGIDMNALPRKELVKLRKRMSMIFQDPYSSLNPRHTVETIITLPLKVHSIGSSGGRKKIVLELLQKVGLIPPQVFLDKFPHELSGGQKQRVGIARALASKPEFIVADEPVSALDVSVRSAVLNLMKDLKDEFGLTYLFIAHDLAVLRHVCDSLVIMYLGKIMEMGNSEDIFNSPKHPYTQALLASVPIPDPTVERKTIRLKGEIPNPIDAPPGCKFHPRCPYCMSICAIEQPVPVEVENRQLVSCHLYGSAS